MGSGRLPPSANLYGRVEDFKGSFDANGRPFKIPSWECCNLMYYKNFQEGNKPSREFFHKPVQSKASLKLQLVLWHLVRLFLVSSLAV